MEAPRALGRWPGAMSPGVAISLLNAMALWRDRGGGSEGADISPEITSVGGQIFARDTW